MAGHLDEARQSDSRLVEAGSPRDDGLPVEEDPSLTKRAISVVTLGTILNPLNSSMIAVALLSVGTAFAVSNATSTWLISSFYLAGAIGMPIAGYLADSFGPRKVFVWGLVLLLVASSLAPFSPSFWWLVPVRCVQAFGSATAYPAGMAIFRQADLRGSRLAGTLTAMAMVGGVSMGLGPPLGGILLKGLGWSGIFIMNVPVATLGIILALLWLPASSDRGASGSQPAGPASIRSLARRIDLLGIALFALALIALLWFLLSLPKSPLWWMLPVSVGAAALLIRHEWRIDEPFLNVRLLSTNYALLRVFAEYCAVNIVFYLYLFGLPIWLEEDLGVSPSVAGLLILPMAVVAVLATPVAGAVLARRGTKTTLMVGSVVLFAASLLLLLLPGITHAAAVLVLSALFGFPTGFNNLGLQASMFRSAPADEMGRAGGQYQTFRYLGAIISVAVLGVVFGNTATRAGLHTVAWVAVAVSGALVVSKLLERGAKPRKGGGVAGDALRP
jgi:MFS family permease